jgi:DNA-binding NarL/FixJ family response regulator
MINVLIVDDHPVVVEGLRKLFCESEAKYSCALAYSVQECEKALKVFIPDIVLLDINLPDGSGIDLCKYILTKVPNCRILALSSFNDRSYITRMLNNGAMGYILKNSSEDEIMLAVAEIMAGKKHMGFEVAEIMKNSGSDQQAPLLTRRETEVLKLIADGLTNQEIADKMFISPLTVDSHRKNLLMKLEARNTAALIKISINKGLIG